MTPLKVLVACETSGIVRDAFLRLGHNAWSCDLLPADTQTDKHIICDARDAIRMERWDLMIGHPPCTRLCNSGVRWLTKPPPGRTLEDMWHDLIIGAKLFSSMWNADIEHIVLENPVMHKHAKARIQGFEEWAQTIQPWQFGTSCKGPDNVKKRTCLWLRNLPKIKPTGTLDGSTARDEVHKATPGPNRWKLRSKFYPGIADAMAVQLSAYILGKEK